MQTKNWNLLTTFALAAAIALPTFSAGGQDEVKNAITATPYMLKALKGGADISASWPIKAIRYASDGTAVSTLADGRDIKSTWTLDAEGRLLVIKTPGVGESRWEILEVSPKIFRKRNLENGVEAVQTPR
jgi:hypothetical protein